MSHAADLELLLDRYVAGECSAAEVLVVRRWVGEDPDRTVLVERLRAVQAVERAQISSADVPRAVAALEAALDATRAPRPKSRGPRMSREARGSFARAAGAAGAAIALVALVMVVRLGHQAPARGREYATARGERETVTLMDGTQIALAPASRVRLAADYGAGRREVDLLGGEAFFTVTHDNARPFTVRADNVVARDVGTRFDVRGYPSDAGVRVAVTQGAVVVADHALQAGDVVTVRDTAMVFVRGVDVEALVGWTRGRLEFHNARASDALMELGRWYGIDIRLDDPAQRARPLTVALDNASPDAAVAAVAATLGLRAVRTGQGVTLSQPARER